MTADTAALQTEISRQQIIINLLIEKNQQLELQLAFANSRLAGTTEAASGPVSAVRVTAPNEFVTPTANNVMQPIGLVALHSEDVTDTIRDGTSVNVELTPSENFVISHCDELMNSKRFVILWSEDQLVAFANSPSPVMPSPVAALSPATPAHREALRRLAGLTTPNSIYRALRRGMPQAHYDGLLNAAALLHHLLAKPTNSYPELMRLLEFSESGVAKILVLLKKKGLLAATSYQQFGLTPLALGYVWEARQSSLNR